LILGANANEAYLQALYSSTAKPLVFKINGEMGRFATNGYFGIGSAAPSGVLHVVTPINTDSGQPRFLSGVTSSAGNWNEFLLGADVSTYNAVMFRYFNGLGSSSGALLNITHYGDVQGISLKGGGNVGIGTTTPGYKLEVVGSVRATSFLSNATTYADFVFEPEYRLAPLSEVEAHIQAKGHLPDIPSAAEAREQGIDLAAMQVKLLQKIEELTLHVIALEKRTHSLERENSALKATR
jgi:hypothetical protein